jgi:GT2 family glycosyltransferase
MIAVLMAAHNRRDRTISCIGSVIDAAARVPEHVVVYLVDDGSIDGTSAAVRAAAPDARIFAGSGNLYWAGAMRLAEEKAVADGAEYLLWLNDDVTLTRESLESLLKLERAFDDPVIVVGAVSDHPSGRVTYSGVRRIGRHPMHYELVAPNSDGSPLTLVDTFNGNVVLMKACVSVLVGGIDRGLVHRAADFDFGLRAHRAGVRLCVAGTVVGTCARNPSAHPAFNRQRPLAERYRALLSPIGAPPRASARYLRRHGGPLWLLFWVVPYVRFAAAAIPIVGQFVPQPRLGPALR